MNFGDFPRCAAYLKACNYRLDDEAMHAKAWAVCASEAFTDEELIADGRVSFEDMPGDAILSEFERLLRTRAHGRHARRNETRRATTAHSDEHESLKAFIGSRGVKVSALGNDADYWKVARILWPHAIKKKDSGPLSLLHHKIKSMPKRSRASARDNIFKVPAEWRGAK